MNYKQKVGCNIENLKGVRDFIRTALKQHGVPDLQISELVLALDAAGIPLEQAVLVRGSRWWDFDCPGACCAPGGGTPLPGEVGNVGIAGHRTTYGRPFNRMDELRAGDVVFLDTGFHFAETISTLRRAQSRYRLNLRVERPDADAPGGQRDAEFEEFYRTTWAHLFRVAYGVAGTLAGDSTRGQAIFEGKGACTGCHRVSGEGSRVGPDLSEIGRLRHSTDIERAILDPCGIGDFVGCTLGGVAGALEVAHVLAHQVLHRAQQDEAVARPLPSRRTDRDLRIDRRDHRVADIAQSRRAGPLRPVRHQSA